MVQVQFYLFDQVNNVAIEGIEVQLDGVPNITDEYGIANFDNITQGIHNYEVRISNYTLDHSLDPFSQPLGLSGTFTIEWALIPGEPWPENIPWVNQFYFIPGEAPTPPPSNGLLVALAAFAGLFLLSKK